MVLHAVTQRGGDAEAMKQAVTIDTTQLCHPDGRVSIATMQRLWPLAMQATADPHLDLHLTEHIHFSSLGVLAYILLHSATLEEAICKLCRYQDITCNGTRTSLRRSGDHAELVVEITSPDIVYTPFVLNSELSVYLHMLRLLCGQPLALEAVLLAYPAPVDAREHNRVFAPAPVQSDAPYSALRLSAAALALPIPTADPHLLALLEPYATAQLARLYQPLSLPDSVRRELLRLLAQAEPSLIAVADALCLSPRTLQLRLRQASHSYQQLFDEVRLELAEHHLRDQLHSIREIAFLLGFTDPSAFVRSFQRWTGQTPGEFWRVG